MEKATKERLTGAAIVVALVGIVVPELLSGPKGGTAAQSTATEADAGPPLATYDLAMDPSSVPGVVRQQDLASAVPAARSEEIAAAVPPPASSAQTSSDAETESSGSSLVASTASEPAPSPAKAAPDAVAPAASTSTARVPPATPQATPTAKPQVSTPAAPAPAAPAASGSWWVQIVSLSSADAAQRLATELRTRGYAIDVTRVRSNGKDLHRVRAGPVKDREAALALQARLATAGQKDTMVTK